MTGLTARQREVLSVIQASVIDRGVPPTYEQIADAVGLSSKASVHRIISGLEERGAVRRIPGRWTTVELTKQASISIRESLYRRLIEAAIEQKTSINAIANEAIAAYLGVGE